MDGTAEQARQSDPLPLAEGERRLGIFRLTPEALASALRLKAGLSVVDIRHSVFAWNLGFEVLVEGPGLPVIPIGGEVPAVMPEDVLA